LSLSSSFFLSPFSHFFVPKAKVSSQSFLLHHKKIMVPCNGKKERSTSTFNPFKVNYNVERWMIFKLNFKKTNKLKNWICSFTNFVQFYVVNNMGTSYIYKSLIEQIFIS
jgi:hypothetical protein